VALITLDSLKTHLGVSGSSQDTALSALVRQATATVRTYAKRNLGDCVSAITAAAAAVVTCLGHGLETGDTITIYGSNSTPTIDGERVVTRLTDDTFSVPVLTTVAGTAGFFARQYTEYISGNGQTRLWLKETPVLSVASVYQDDKAHWGAGDDPFPASALLVAGTDYALVRDGNPNEVSKTGGLEKIGGVWNGAMQNLRGRLVPDDVPGTGNIKVTYTAGYRRLPSDLQLAVLTVANSIKASAQSGGPMQSESLDYYSYTRMDAGAEARAIGSAKQLLAAFAQKRWVW
jgi:hypothetical protein